MNELGNAAAADKSYFEASCSSHDPPVPPLFERIVLLCRADHPCLAGSRKIERGAVARRSFRNRRDRRRANRAKSRDGAI